MSPRDLVRLGDVATIVRKTISPERISDGTTYVGLENIERGGALLNVTSVNQGDLASAKFEFTADQVLFGKLRPYLAKIARPAFSGVCSTDILPITPGPGIDKNYLAQYLSTPDVVALAAARATGANLPRLSPGELAKFEIPLPLLDEQRRIAAILDQADALRAKRREALAHLDDLTQSIFVDMFGDPDTNPKRLPVSRLRDLCRLGTGSTPSRKVQRHYGGAIPWVKTGEVAGGRIHVTEEHLTELRRAAGRCRVYPVESIVMALYGQGKTRGQCAVLGIDAATNQACAVLQPDPRYDTTFLFAQLRLSYERLRSMARGGNQANLNLGLVGGFEVVVPEMVHQQEFSRHIERLTDLRNHESAQLAELDSLFASLQSRAFAGGL